MLRRRTLHRPPSRTLVAAVAALGLMLGLGTLSAPAGAVVGAAPTVTVLHVSSGSPALGATVTLTAAVTAGGDPVPYGEVLFDAAPSESTLWGADSYVDPFPEPSDVSWGPVSLDGDGTVSITITVDATTLPFLVAGTPFRVAAGYQPYDGVEVYDTEFSESESEPVEVTTTAPAPTATTTRVTGPLSATVGTATSLTAAVAPAEARGTVQFSVDGAPVGPPVSVVGGSASLSATFGAVGTRTVTAAFTPTNSHRHLPSQDAIGQSVTVAAPEATSIAIKTKRRLVPAGGGYDVVPDDGSSADVRVAVTTATGATPTGNVEFRTPDGGLVGVVPLIGGAASWPDENDFFYKVDVPLVPGITFTFVLPGVVATYVPDTPRFVLSTVSADLGAMLVGGISASSTATGAAVGTGSTTVQGTSGADGDVYVVVDTGRQGSGTGKAVVTTTRASGRATTQRATSARVVGLPTSRGYVFPLGKLAPNTAFTVKVSYPLPSSAAGRKLVVTAGAVSVDPVTGTSATLVAAAKHTVKVPRRTVLSASLLPIKKKTPSVKRGAKVGYRLAVKNIGIVTADHVRACVTLPKGAKLRSAKGARVHARRACWTLAALEKGRGVTRTLVVVAPNRKGDVKISTRVKPKKSQASPIRLATALPVR